MTCTLGEEGEVLVPEPRPTSPPTSDDALGEHRIDELATAMAVLGVTDHRFLGGAGRYRDSGMMGPPTQRPAGLLLAGRPRRGRRDLLVEVIREVRPQVLVTYDENGGYGHPDHIQAHRVAMRGVELAADPVVPAATSASRGRSRKVYWNAMPRVGPAARASRAARGRRHDHLRGWNPTASCRFVVPDELVTTGVDATDLRRARRWRRMRAHATQITVDGPFFALSNNLGQRRVGPRVLPPRQGYAGAASVTRDGRETDLFAGVD